MNFEELRKANDLIKTVPIEKKDRKTGIVTTTAYSPVHQRINAFRSVFPEGMILSELISATDGIYVFKATVMTPEGITLGIGHASEKEGSSFINQTSALENAETSAVGRALGMAGFGIDGGLASAEEMQNALLQQAEDKAEPKPDPYKPTPLPYKPDDEEDLPWTMTEAAPICQDCGQQIQARKTRKGDMWQPDSIAQYTLNKFGRKLCVDCMKKAEAK